MLREHNDREYEKVNHYLPCEDTYLDRDSAKPALVEFPLVNPLSERNHDTLLGPSADAAPGLLGSLPASFIKLALVGDSLILC